MGPAGQHLRPAFLVQNYALDKGGGEPGEEWAKEVGTEMKLAHRMGLPLLVLSAAAMGCHSANVETVRTVAAYPSAAGPKTARAYSGIYYLEETRPEGSRRVASLIQGDVVGFERDDRGRLVGVAGDERIPLTEGTYAWKHPLPPSPYGPPNPAGDVLNGLVLVAFAPIVNSFAGIMALLGHPLPKC